MFAAPKHLSAPSKKCSSFFFFASCCFLFPVIKNKSDQKNFADPKQIFCSKKLFKFVFFFLVYFLVSNEPEKPSESTF